MIGNKLKTGLGLRLDGWWLGLQKVSDRILWIYIQILKFAIMVD